MYYWDLPEHARALGLRTQELMREYDVLPTPSNYELWFGYAAGQNQELIRTLDIAVHEGRHNDPNFMRDLYGRFFGAGGQVAMEEMGTKLQEEVLRFAQVLEGTGQDTASYGRMLNVAASHLSSGDVSQIKAVIEGVAAATRAMETKQKALESDLQSSANEISVLRSRMETIRKESLLDALTGLANRRCFDERIEQAMREVQTEGGELCVLVGDVDHFKKFNDTWGHATGDQVLRLVGQCFKSNIKGRDTAARYGGEEFAVVLPQTSIDNAITLAEQIRHAVESKKIVKRSTGETLGSITLSLGVAKYRPGEPVAETINRADQCLYSAKRTGRNRVVAETNVDVTEEKQAAAS